MKSLILINADQQRFMIFKIAQFRYFKIQLETKDITTRLRGINHINLLYYSSKPRSDVFCFKLNFNISKLAITRREYIIYPRGTSE